MALEEVGVRLSLRDRVRFGRDARGAAQDVDKLGDRAEKTGKQLGRSERGARRAGKAFGGVLAGGARKGAAGLGRFVKFAAKAGPLALAGMAVGAVAAGRSFLNLASQLEATGNKARTVFGDQLGGFTGWAEQNAAQMGLTTNELVGMGAGFADLLIPMGFTRKRASELTQETLILSGALSQWSTDGKSAAEVGDILSSAMLGETDALKGLGIGLSAAAVDAKLLERGQNKLTGAALEQATAQATLDLVLSKSTDAQAQYAAGGNRLLSAQARLSAGWRTLKEQLAQRFAPHAANMLQRLVDRIPMLTRAANDFVTGAWPGVRDGLRSFGESLGRVGDKASGLLGMDGKARTFGEVVGSVIGGAITLFGRFVEIAQEAGLALSAFIRETLRSMSTFSAELAEVFAGMARVKSPLQDTFKAAAVGLGNVAAGTQKAANALDRMMTPRTATFTTVYRSATAAGAAPGQARAEAADRRATGGRFALGHPTLVGERGPELIVPQQHGYVLTAQRTASTMLGALPDADGGAEGDLDSGRPIVHEHHVYLDGRQITASVKTHIRNELARR